jgi:hypothetical protein
VNRSSRTPQLGIQQNNAPAQAQLAPQQKIDWHAEYRKTRDYSVSYLTCSFADKQDILIISQISIKKRYEAEKESNQRLKERIGLPKHFEYTDARLAQLQDDIEAKEEELDEIEERIEERSEIEEKLDEFEELEEEKEELETS